MIVRKAWLLVMLLIVVLPRHSYAQEAQVLPEVDVYYRLNSAAQIYFQAKGTREAGAPVTAEIGPSMEIYLKKLSDLVHITKFDRDKSKEQLLVFSFGYRYLPYPGAPPVNRLEPYAEINIPTRGALFISDRNRFDLDWYKGNFSWEYRNRPTIEWPRRIRRYHFSPYVSAEFWHTSQYSKWSTTSLFAGSIFPFGKHVDFNPYYEHENNTGGTPNQQLNQLGLMLNLWF